MHPGEEIGAQVSDGFLLNGSENNAATSKYSISPAFGNLRPGVKSLYTGSVGFVVNNSVFDARPYSLTGPVLPKAQCGWIAGVVTLGGPLKIPHFAPTRAQLFRRLPVDTRSPGEHRNRVGPHGRGTGRGSFRAAELAWPARDGVQPSDGSTGAPSPLPALRRKPPVRTQPLPSHPRARVSPIF